MQNVQNNGAIYNLFAFLPMICGLNRKSKNICPFCYFIDSSWFILLSTSISFLIHLTQCTGYRRCQRYLLIFFLDVFLGEECRTIDEQFNPEEDWKSDKSNSEFRK